jgi:hypothetical protein
MQTCVGRDFIQQLAEYYEAVDRLVLAAVKLGSRGWFCCRARLHVALFMLTREFEELAPLRRRFGLLSIDVDVSLKSLVERGLLEEKLEIPGAVDGAPLPGYGVYMYRLTWAGRILASKAVKEVSPRIRKRMKELLKLDVWSLIGYAYVKYPLDAWPIELA